MKTIQRLLMGGFGVGSIVLVGCASETVEKPDGKGPPPPSSESSSTTGGPGAHSSGGITTQALVCSTTYSDVVPAYIDYASVHCEGWTGKVFCEYSSLSDVYGPGWGTCQCYNTTCYDDGTGDDDGRMQEKRGRHCWGWWCW